MPGSFSFYNRFLKAGLLTLLLALSVFNGHAQQAATNSFSVFKKNFAVPDKKYGTAPLWVWNTKVTKADIDEMMQSFKDEAFGGVFIHPRPGMITEYLSPEWFELYTYAVNKGKQLGLDVWIYDENSYPSGFAGGNVPAQMPEAYNQGQMLSMKKVNTLPKDVSAYYLCLKENGDVLSDITASVNLEHDKTGKYYLFKKAFYRKTDWNAGFSYVDLMVKGVTEKFIDITMKGYEKHFGNEFGKTVPGIFSDEMNIQVQLKNHIRWTPDLFEAFKQSWGYDLKLHLPALIEKTGDWKKIRHNYYQTLLQLFIDRWSKPFNAYTQKKGLEWTGHYWEHAWPVPNEGIDNMAMYAWHQRPGIDMLFNRFNEKGAGTWLETQFGNIRSVKELSSVANQLNKKRTLCEAYAGGGWELKLKDLKRLGDWMYVLGVNTLNQHLSHMTIKGARKYDYPQTFSYQNPWYPYYKEQNKYFSRLSYALSQGQQINNILVLEPTTTAWMYAQEDKKLTDIAEQFPAFVTRLEKAHVEYDLGSENIIKDYGKVVNGKFIIGQRQYTTVVLPPGMENVDAATFKFLKEYANQGGKIIRFDELQTLNGQANTEVSTFNNAKGILAVKQLDEEVIVQHFRNAAFKITAQGGNLFHHRRIYSGGQVLFISNADMEKSSVGSINVKGNDVLLMDPFTGAITDYPEVVKNGSVSFNFNVSAAGSMLFFIADKKQKGLIKYTPTVPYRVVKADTPIQVIRPALNNLVIDFCDITLKGNTLKDLYVFKAADTVFKHHGFKSGNPWHRTVQFKNQTVERDTFRKSSGFIATYHFTIGDNVNFKQFKAVVEQAWLYKQINVNGQPVQVKKDNWWIDKTFTMLEIGGHLKAGDNVLELIADPMSVFAEIQPVYIRGDFNLESTEKGWNIIRPAPLTLGSWKKQDMPLYGHDITYTAQYTINDTGKYAVKAGEWNGTVIAVKVNGAPAGTIAYNPYLLEVSKYLHKGSNKIEVKVVGSLKNLLGPHHNNPPEGYVTPGLWTKIPEHAAGDKYHIYDYGLMQAFELIQLK